MGVPSLIRGTTHATVSLVSSLCWAALTLGDASAASVSLQQGSGGYAGTRDTSIFHFPDNPAMDNANFGTHVLMNTQSGLGYERYALLRFLDIFGAGPGQVPLGSTIASATLTVDSTQAGLLAIELPVTVHRVLHAWDDATLTYSNFGTNPGAQIGEDYESASLGTLMLGANDVRSVDLTAALQLLSDGAQDFGWLFRLVPPDPPSSTVRSFFSSEVDARTGVAPRLSIEFGPPRQTPEPAAWALAAGALGLALWLRARRKLRQD